MLDSWSLYNPWHAVLPQPHLHWLHWLPVRPAPSTACHFHLPAIYVPAQLLLSFWRLLLPFSWLLQPYVCLRLYVFLRRLYVQLLSSRLPYALPQPYVLPQPSYVLLRLFAVAPIYVFLQPLCFQRLNAPLLSWPLQLNCWLFAAQASAGLAFCLVQPFLQPSVSVWPVRLRPVLVEYYPSFAVPYDAH